MALPRRPVGSHILTPPPPPPCPWLFSPFPNDACFNHKVVMCRPALRPCMRPWQKSRGSKRPCAWSSSSFGSRRSTAQRVVGDQGMQARAQQAGHARASACRKPTCAVLPPQMWTAPRPVPWANCAEVRLVPSHSTTSNGNCIMHDPSYGSKTD